MRQELETKLKSSYVTPKNRTHRMIVNAIDEEPSECIYNTATRSKPNTPYDIEEASKASDKNERRKSAESKIEIFLTRGSWVKV